MARQAIRKNTEPLRNYLLNGNFDLWQRGTSVTSTSAYGADRWRGNSAINTQIRQTSAFASGLSADATYCNQVTSLAGGGAIAQRIESKNAKQLLGKYVTFSFKSALVSGTTQLFVRIRKPTVIDNWASNTIVYTSSSFSTGSLSSFVKYSYTFLVDADMAEKGFSVEIEGDATVWSIVVSECILNVAESAAGYVPSKFVYFGDNGIIGELENCLRYYTKSGINPNSPWYPGVATNADFDNRISPRTVTTTDRSTIAESFKVQMRAVPALAIYPGRSAVAPTLNRLTAYNSDTLVTYTATLNISPSGFYGYFQSLSLNSEAYTFQYTAEAEL